MNEKTLQEVIEFCKIVGKLKNIERTGWITFFKIENPESVAEHIYRTAVIAMLIGDLKKLDTEKMIRMALLHDLSEAITGDWDMFAKKRLGMEKFREREKQAIDKLIATLPENLRQEYSKLWDELIAKKSEEAKVVMEIDKIELAFQNFEYRKESSNKQKVESFYKYVEDRISDEDLKKILELVKRESASDGRGK